MTEPGGPEDVAVRPFARLGRELRHARESKDVSLRKLARELYTSHSNLHDYELGFRLAPEQIVQGYETKLDLDSGSLLRLREELASGHARGSAATPAPVPAVRQERVPTPSRSRRPWLILIAAGILVGVALSVRAWMVSPGGRVDLARVGDRLSVGDYDGDGMADVAMAYDLGSGRMRIDRWASTGSGFTAATKSKSFRLGVVGGRMASGDVNGDGREDIVMAAQQDSAFSYHVWLAGSIYVGTWYTSGPFNLAAVGDRFTVGDYTGDGKADTAMAYDLGDGTMQVHLWTSTGSGFTALAAQPPDAVRASPVADRMASGDVNGDRRDDIVMAYANPDGSFTYHVWSGGSSYAGTWFTSGMFSMSLVDDRLTVGDYTGDGKADAAVGYDVDGSKMQVIRWTSSGSVFGDLTRAHLSAFDLENVAGRMGSGDLDADGRDDIVMAYQNRDGTFSYHVWTAGSSYGGTWFTSGS